MKKTLLTLGFIGAVAIASAQTGQGTWMLGGGAGFNSKTTTKTSTMVVATPATLVAGASTEFNWNLSPNLGYFVIDKLAVGLELGLGSKSQTNPTVMGFPIPAIVNLESSQFEWNLGPFVRYYFMFGDNMGLYGHVGIGLGGRSGTEPDFAAPTPGTTKDSDPVSIFKYNVGPGFAVFLNENVALQATLLYSGTTETTEVKPPAPALAYEDKDAVGEFGLNVGFQIHFGGGK